MPISANDVVTMQMFDATAGSKTLGVLANNFFINNAANSTQILSLTNTGDLTNSGALATGATTTTTLNASSNDALLYTNTSAQSIPNNTGTTVTGWTKTYDRVNANFNAATGVFTAPATAMYHVDVQLAYASAATVAGAQYSVTILNNGGVVDNGQYFAETATSLQRVVRASAIVSMVAGQTITIQTFQNSGGAIALSSTATTNSLSIVRIP
jgi:hypothetical protein